MENRFEKQGYEEFTITGDFSENFASGETISSQTVEAIDVDGIDVAATVTNQASIANDGNAKVSVLVRGGSEAASPYKITMKCVTSAGHKWELDIEMAIREI